MTALCPYGESGCPDNEGDYDIVMPEPMSGTSGSGYKVRVMDVDDESDMDCSDEFYLMASDQAADTDSGPYLSVTSPAEGDMAEACGDYTIEVSSLLLAVRTGFHFSPFDSLKSDGVRRYFTFWLLPKY